MGSQRLPRRAPEPLRRSPPVPLHDAPVVALPPEVKERLAGVRWPWPQASRLADVLEPERNNFSALRLMLALAVVVSHAVFLASGQHAAEPLVALTGYSLGQYGVQGFFILSGLLVTQSLIRRASVPEYLIARAFRIFPALIVCVLATALLLGPALTYFTLPGYFLSAGLYEYLVKTLSLSSGSAQLPGLFQLNPAGGVVNQSLWTLKYEVACYLLLGGLAVVGARLKLKKAFATAAVAVWAALMILIRPSLAGEPGFLAVLSYFSLFFGTGVAAYLLRDTIRLSWQPLPLLFAAFVLAIRSDMAELTSALFLGYGLLWLATLKTDALRSFTNANDYSYGCYIYSFPASQAILAVWPDANLVALVSSTLAATMLLAFLSWEVIERPALAMVRKQLAGTRPAAAVGRNVQAAPILAVPSPESPSPAAVVTAPVATPAPRAARMYAAVKSPKPESRKPVVAAPVIDRSRLNARLARIASEGNKARQG